LSIDGRYFAYTALNERQPGEVGFFDIAEWAEVGRVTWEPEGDIVDLAFSPDGQTLVTISQAGVVKLLPWRTLLGV
jgi:hypothetical protein